ncbi:NitT/TauT family transport system substrate-binding protein [Rhodospirillales bacterium URHD0017]|nr:NitT/TauT family transport system substrate-binding protein [Rhodospirillales bacterium URHD0017]
MAIIRQEALRGLFYAPFYVALARDAFAGEGVEIRFTSSPHPNETALRVMDGTVDVSRGGPMRVMETYHKLPGCDLVCFGEVVTRDPSC